MTSRRWWWASGAALLLALGLGLTVARVPLFFIRQERHDLTEVQVRGESRARQTIASHYPGLTRIAVQPQAPWPADDQLITLRLVDLTSGAGERLTLTRPVSELRQGTVLAFVFEPLDDTAGKTYAFEVETQGPAPLRLLSHQQNMYTGGTLAGGGDLMFWVSFDGRVWPTVGAAVARLGAGKPGLLAQPWFYLGLGLAYCLALGSVLRAVAQQAARAAAGAPPSEGGPA